VDIQLKAVGPKGQAALERGQRVLRQEAAPPAMREDERTRGGEKWGQGHSGGSLTVADRIDS